MFGFVPSRGGRNRAISAGLKKRTMVSGIEMAGIVESDGERLKIGDRVAGYTHIFKGPFFHAQYVAVPENNLALLPDNVTLEGATSIVGGALTSINSLERVASLTSGNRVLLTGATGRVGVTGVQLGADVSAVCHSSQTDSVRPQGASQAYAYDNKELPEAEKSLIWFSTLCKNLPES